MYKKKKWLAILVLMTTVLILSACGGKEESSGGSISDNPRNHSAEDFMPISEGVEKYSVWIETDENPVRDSVIKNIYAFNKDKVTVYNMTGDNTKQKVVIEDILDMSDEKIITFAQETSNKIYDDYEQEVEDAKLFDIEGYNEELEWRLEDHYQELGEMAEAYHSELKPMTEDIKYSIEGERNNPSQRTYTFDITIDELGQSTEKVDLIIPNATSKLVYTTPSGIMSDYIDFLYFDIEAILYKMEGMEDIYNGQIEYFIGELEKHGSFVERNGFERAHPQNFVPNPAIWEEEDKVISLEGASFNQKIFETTFSGIKTNNGSFITRVDDSFVGFRLDTPDTEKKNVTIEGK